jgi:hypothetical protein
VTAAVGLDKLAGGNWFTRTAARSPISVRRLVGLVTGWGGVALFPMFPWIHQTRKRAVDSTTLQPKQTSTKLTGQRAPAFADLDGDLSRLYVCQYVDWSWKNHPACTITAKRPMYVAKNFSGLPPVVWNDGKAVSRCQQGRD